VCARADNCVITVANRRKCKKCRFTLCQQAGMTESAILTEEQKKMRFRKMIQKREAMMNLQNAIKDEEKSPTQPHEIPYIQQMSVSRSRKKEKSIETGFNIESMRANRVKA
jgi:hypothetical protein